MKNSSNKDINPATHYSDDFIQEFGTLAELDGFSRINGLFMGLMIISPEPIAFRVISERLEISRGSVSMTARRLMDAGLVRRVRVKGSREHYYEIADNPFANYIYASSRIIERAHYSALNAYKLASGKSDIIQRRLEQLNFYYLERLKSQKMLHHVLKRMDEER